jgi:two-component system NtrC family sensor kinase
MGSNIFLFIAVILGAVALALAIGRLLEKAFHDSNDSSKDIIGLREKLDKTSHDLEDAHAQLINAEKMASLGQLAAGVAHEVNNPLSYVTTNLQLLQNYAAKLNAIIPDGDPMKKDLSEIISESLEGVRRIKNIVNSLVLFSQTQPEQQQYCDINEIIESATVLLWHEIKHKCELVKDLGPLPQILVHSKLLNHAFFNIIQNAYQAMPVKGTITITSRLIDEFIVVVITDTGVGIPHEKISKIFEPFFKVDPSSSNVGIGLSVAYGVIRRHGGTIDIDSKLDQGTSVKIKLPTNQNANTKGK